MLKLILHQIQDPDRVKNQPLIVKPQAVPMLLDLVVSHVNANVQNQRVNVNQAGVPQIHLKHVSLADAHNAKTQVIVNLEDAVIGQVLTHVSHVNAQDKTVSQQD